MATYNYRGRNSLKTLVGELRAKIQGTGIVNTTFLNQESSARLTDEQKLEVEAALRRRLELWYNAHIEPLLAEIEAKDPKVKEAKAEKEREARVVKVEAAIGGDAYTLPEVGNGCLRKLRERVLRLHELKFARHEVIDYICDAGYPTNSGMFYNRWVIEGGVL